MKIPHLLLAAAIAWVGSAPPGQQPIRRPAGPPPRIVVVVEFAPERGELVVEQTKLEQVPILRHVPVDKGGVIQQVPVTELVTKNVTSRVKHQLKECDFYSGAGKKLTDEEARKQLKAGSVLLVSADRKLADAYRKALRDDVVILVSNAPVVPPTAPPPGPKPLPLERNR